jgi:hypothetical protein
MWTLIDLFADKCELGGRPKEGESARGEQIPRWELWELSTHTINIARASAMDQEKK